MMENVTGMSAADQVNEIRKYSVLVGVLLVLVFVVPCITLAFLAKCFQKQSSHRRKNSVAFSSTGGGSFRRAGEECCYDTATVPDSDSSGFGTFGLIVIPARNLECTEKLVNMKHQLSCIDLWKGYAPAHLSGDCRKLIVVLKSAQLPSASVSGKESHAACLKAELSYLSRIPSHHAILNLLGVCSPSANLSANISALMLEYPLYGSLYSFLVCKRLGGISKSSKSWAGLDYQVQEDSVLRALPDENRQFLSRLLDDYRVRQRPFAATLDADFTDVDLLLFALQVANGMQFLVESGVNCVRQLSAESITISVSFFLKLSCLSPDTAFPMHKRTMSGGNQPSSRRTSSGRNMMKWDAPEVVERNESNEKSNVWRYGMVLWEISSLGDTPYAEVPGKCLLEQMKKGAIPHLPGRCSNAFYSTMKRCWQTDSSARPTFDDVTRIILSQLQPHEVMDDCSGVESFNQLEEVSYNSPQSPVSSDCSQAVLIAESGPEETEV